MENFVVANFMQSPLVTPTELQPTSHHPERLVSAMNVQQPVDSMQFLCKPVSFLPSPVKVQELVTHHPERLVPAMDVQQPVDFMRFLCKLVSSPVKVQQPVYPPVKHVLQSRRPERFA